MKNNYDASFEAVIGHEGGYTDDRRDRGNWTTGKIGKGELKGTKYGISAMSYPDLDIPNLTLEQAKEIYKDDYWDKVKGDQLPVGVDYLVFDVAINHGPTDAGVFLQKAIGAVPDGVIGPRTLKRLDKKDVEQVIKETSVQRALDYASLKAVSTFGKGWYRRLIQSTIDAIDMHRVALDPSKGVSNSPAFNELFRRV